MTAEPVRPDKQHLGLPELGANVRSRLSPAMGAHMGCSTGEGDNEKPYCDPVPNAAF